MKTVNIDEAIHLLQQGEVVAIPTETVYGLAGWIYSEKGLNKIFSAKERPFFDPLIVHVSDISKARSLSSDWSEAHEALASGCWPGPLTLIAPKTEQIHPLITSGLMSVGLRCPRHPKALELLSRIEGGLAAPSANKFGKTSPTSPEHVYEEFNDQVAILEGGNCEIGIESTVVGISKESDDYIVEIYRPGFYTASMLEAILLQKGIKARVVYTQSPVAPGQLKHHYMPRIPLVIVPQSFDWNRNHHLVEEALNKKFLRPIVWKLSPDARLASRQLYQELRSFDQQGHDIILLSKEAHHEQEDWLGIWNRLSKAKTLEL